MLSELKTKINLKRFFLLSILSLIVTLCFSRNVAEFFTILGVYGATLLYLYIFFLAVKELFRPYTDPEYTKKKDGKGKVLALFATKLLVLIIALLLGVQIMGSRIIICVINYILQILILGVSFKKGK